VKLIALKSLVVAIFLLLVSDALDVPPTKAGPQTVYGYTCVSYIPAEWGEFKAAISNPAWPFRTTLARFASSPTCRATPRRSPRSKFVAPRQQQTSPTSTHLTRSSS
jgi:hypothetical protein